VQQEKYDLQAKFAEERAQIQKEKEQLSWNIWELRRQSLENFAL
jgi:hypothetical protein